MEQSKSKKPYMGDNIKIDVCKENIASCNGCAARNYVSSVDGRPADLDILYELHIGSLYIRLCKNCLKKISKEILEVL